MMFISSGRHQVCIMKLLLWFAFAISIADGKANSGSQYTLSGVYNEDDFYEEYSSENEDEETFETFDDFIDDDDVEDRCRKHANKKTEWKAWDKKVIKPTSAVTGRLSVPRRVTSEVEDNVADVSIMRNRRTDYYVHDQECEQITFQEATRDLIRDYDLSRQEIHEILPQHGEHCKRARDDCMLTKSFKSCHPRSPYRTEDGSCNNLQNPRWGSTFTCFKRLLTASYEEGCEFRQSFLGGPLPPPRIITLNVHKHMTNLDCRVNALHVMFGQFIDHDFTQTPISTAEGKAIQCCPPSKDSHPQCAPITIFSDDPFYSKFNTTCMNFVRSAICPTCTLGPRQHMNQVTAFIDLSLNYDCSKNATLALRANDGTGHLLTEKTKYGEFLPSSNPQTDFCSNVEKNQTCFKSGDSRVNQHPAIAALQTIFVLEHNRVADQLHKLNPKWNDEKLFQEARRIVVAEMQFIVYKEYLPLVLGPEIMTFFHLWPLRGCKTTRYNKKIDPSIIHEFATAAFRFGHSTVAEIFARIATKFNSKTKLKMRNVFFQPYVLRRPGFFARFMKALTHTRAERRDRHMVPDLTNFCYRVKGTPAGIDLSSINIQRGRDHGMPPYVEMVHFCCDNSFEIKSFEDLVKYKLMTDRSVKSLQSCYGDVKDMDLWTGILSEVHIGGALIGQTGACIIGLQFYRLKFGDRFYFEHGNQVGSFTCDQMKELKKVTLTSIICENTNVVSLPKNAMLLKDKSNPEVLCKNVKGINFIHWKVRNKH